MEQDNIISVRKRDPDMANAAFAHFMRLTESAMNDRANHDPKGFSALSASQLETLSVHCMKEVCGGTPFRAEEIRLVAGQSFPDIITETFYGVEVKSTQSDHWTSTGSSIIETTRDKNVESIYLLFGKLGGVPQVRCRPYEDCLYDITVTHSPRYLIDMGTAKEKTIFAKMHTSYNALRLSNNSIAQVRKYYRDKAKAEHKGEMPWWLDDVESDNLMIRHITALTAEEKRRIIMQLFILFPSHVIHSNYVEPAMWLVAYHRVVSHNMRDLMSAGGQAKFLNEKELSRPVPAIVKRFLEFSSLIRSEIDRLYAEIDVFNPELLQKQDTFLAWVEQVDDLLRKTFGDDIHFAQWVANGDTLAVKI
ncbi:MAG: hypothetical protein HUK03_08040 [Bacteroidaceae bacterium]|nr:hypothetical protein [Bacteroidaceae bacterium]